MLKTTVTRISKWNSFFISNIHAQGLHTLYLIKRLLPRKPTQFINLPLELINFTLFGMWTCHNGFTVPNFFKTRTQINSCGVSGSILMRYTFGGWFLIGYKVYGSIFLVLSFNSFFSHYERS
jgi:hypothetical protein